MSEEGPDFAARLEALRGRIRPWLKDRTAELEERPLIDRGLVPMRYDPHTTQVILHRAARDIVEARFVIADAGRRWGKTQSGAAEFARRYWWDYCRKLAKLGPWAPAAGKEPKPYLRYAVVAPTYALLNEPKIALQQYLGTVKEGGVILDDQQSDATWWLRGGVRIDFLSGDRPERLVSHAYNGIWLEEAARMKAAVWVDNLRPTLGDNQGWAIFTSTPLGKNWFWEEVWCKANDEAAAELAQLQGRDVSKIRNRHYVGLHFTTADNTSIPGLADEMMRAEEELPRAMFLRNYYASFDAFAGQLFDLVPLRHMAQSPAPGPYQAKRAVCGGDLGTTHPSSFTLSVEDRNLVWWEVGTVSAPDVLFDVDRDWDRRDTMPDRELKRACWTVQVYRLMRSWVGDDSSAWKAIKLFLPADRPDVKRQFRARGFKVHDAYQEHEPAVTFFQGLLHSDRYRFRSSVLWRSVLNLRVPEAGKASTKLWVAEHDDQWDGMRYGFSELIEKGENPMRGEFRAMGWLAR